MVDRKGIINTSKKYKKENEMEKLDNKKFIQAYKIYKPKKDGTGTASQFCFAKDKGCLFLEMASQLPTKDENDNAIFGWKDKISFKLGPVDIAELLLVLHGIKNGAGPKDKFNTSEKYNGLFHSTASGNSILKFEIGKYDGFYLGLNIKKGESAPVALKHSLTSSEGMILRILLEKAIELIYDWD